MNFVDSDPGEPEVQDANFQNLEHGQSSMKMLEQKEIGNFQADGFQNGEYQFKSRMVANAV